MPISSHEHAGAVFGSHYFAVTCSKQSMLYDVKMDTWYVLPSLEVQRTLPSVAVLGSRLLVVGGWANENEQELSTVECLDVEFLLDVC